MGLSGTPCGIEHTYFSVTPKQNPRNKMSGGLSSLAITEDDITKMLAATVHIGSDNSETTMEQYVFKKKNDGINIINLKKTWEKILLAARAIAAVGNPADVFVCASRPYTQRAVLKFARYVNCSPVAGRFTPGAFCNIDSPTKFIDIAIPCNNKSPHSIGLMWWMLAREVLRLRGSIGRGSPWEVMPDLFFYRDPEEAEKEEKERAETAEAQMMKTGDFNAAPQKEDWGGEEGVTDWNADGAPAPAAAAAPAISAPTGYQVTEDWSAQTETSDCSAEAPAAPQAAPAQTWGGSQNW